MPDLDSIVDVSITAATSTPSRPGFGTTLIAGYHTLFADLVREYTSLAGFVADGATSAHPLYKAVASHFSQKPRPKKVKIGKLTTAVACTRTITITSATEGDIVSFTIVSPDGTETEISYTILTGATTTTVATAVELLVEAAPDITSSPSSAVITAACSAGSIFYLRDLVNCTQTDTTPDASVDDGLDAISAVDSDWFGLVCTIESHTNTDDIAVWAEANRKLFVAHSADEGEIDGTGTIGSGLKAAGYDFTVPIWSADTDHYPAAAWIGRMLATLPGSSTWIYKKLAGVTVDALSASEESALEADNWSFYKTMGSRNTTQTAKTASGEFVDLVVGIEWMRSEIKLSVWDLLSAAEKVDYDDAGIEQICGVVRGVLQQGVERKFLDAGNPDNDIDPPFCTAPRVADIPTADRANRHVPGIEFGGRLRGAVHKTAIAGTLTV